MTLTPYFLAQALSAQDCDRLMAQVAAHPLRDAGLVKGTTAHQIRRADIAWLDDLPQCSWAMDQMIGHVAAANRDHFGFALSEFGESAQVARYGAEREGHFDWHSDIGVGQWAAQRKLTIVVQLSDPGDYDGGALELRGDSSITAAPRERGLATIFPSFMLHRVTPVTKGIRWSLTLWAHGPAFR
jgi:PKHD-type hydroxylase